jgi:hypothetical protein
MRCFLSIAVAGLSAVLAVHAGEGVPPRASSSDYPASQQAQNAIIAAAPVSRDLVKKLFPSEVNKNYVVLEVAVFPLEGQTAYIDSFDFSLKVNADEVSYPRPPEAIVSVWAEKSAPQPPSKVGVTGETGVVYSSGKDPVNGRSSGWGTYSGVEVGPGQPTPPQPLSTDPQVFEANVRARALPQGAAVRPIAGYLYFPVAPKKRKSGPMELQYLKDGALVTLTIPAK